VWVTNNKVYALVSKYGSIADRAYLPVEFSLDCTNLVVSEVTHMRCEGTLINCDLLCVRVCTRQLFMYVNGNLQCGLGGRKSFLCAYNRKWALREISHQATRYIFPLSLQSSPEPTCIPTPIFFAICDRLLPIPMDGKIRSY
jgi:hypothetical protein